MNNLPTWYLVLGGLLSILTVAGNGIVIYLIVTRHRLHTTVNWFILSLAIADFSIGAGYFLVEYFCNEYKCDHTIWYAIGSFLLAASGTNLCLMTLDRYIAIVKPLKYVTFMTTRRVVFLISTAWLAVFLPHLIFLVKVVIFESAGDAEKFMIFDCVVFEILALVILSFATTHIFLITRRHSRQNAALVAQLRFNQRIEHGNEASTHSQETSSAKMLGVAVTVFIISYTSELLYTVFVQLSEEEDQNRHYLHIKDLLLFLNSAVNPVAYALFKSDIKKSLRSMFRCSRGTHELQPQRLHTERDPVAPQESTV